MIDPRAIVDPAARLADDVSVGPFSIIGPGVEIGAGTTIGPHAVVKGPTRIGRDNRIYPFASIGEDPQDKKYAGEPTRLEIGDGNLFREYVTVHRGTVQGGGVTRIGDRNWIMIGCHIAHDCVVGSDTIFSNNAALAGHVTVEDHAILGGYTLVHQFCAIGAHCFTAMGSVISKDVPPYVLVSGHMAKPYGLNVEGLKRRGFSAETIAELRRAYKLLYKSKLTLEQAVGEIRALARTTPEAGALVAFIEASTRGVIR
ncbi:MAG: acyl-ACP--UDP-N-acetylglucosamine O-acyltransferase [Gammaproteobacteria bacterium]|nr:acyl-ACP--UDP-N-acetylglucosamine O-acyltransferase [Gammaproteobacteria bacterium]